MQHQILIIVMIFFAYALNLPLNTQRPHHRSQRTGKLGLCRRILHSHSQLVSPFVCVPGSAPLLAQLPTEGARSAKQKPKHTHTKGACDCGILAHGSRPIYRAPTYIAVPFHGPHQPRYIGLTLY